MSVIINIMYT